MSSSREPLIYVGLVAGVAAIVASTILLKRPWVGHISERRTPMIRPTRHFRRVCRAGSLTATVRSSHAQAIAFVLLLAMTASGCSSEPDASRLPPLRTA